MPPPSPTRFPLKTALAIATVAVVLILWHLLAANPTGLNPRTLPEVAKLPALRQSARRQPEPNVQGPGPTLPVPATDNTQHKTQNIQPSSTLLIDPASALTPFFAALAAPNRTTTVLHFGDSPTTADLITGDIRLTLQQRFGDAGPGFNLPAKPWAWYQHRDIDESDHNWKWTTAVGYRRPVPAGIGGAAFDGGTNASTRFKFSAAAPASVDIAFQTQLTGGIFTLTANNADQPFATITTLPANPDPLITNNEQPTTVFHSIPLPADTRTLELRVTAGTVRLYGLSFLTSHPGVLYDSLGLNGASITVLSRAISTDTLQSGFEHLHPDLIVINYGTNEAGFASWINKANNGYEAELRLAVLRVRQAAPQASILIMSPMDRGERGDGNEIRTMPSIPSIVAIQQRVAAETGCAFFNTYAAMGGENTMQRWYEGHPRLVGGDLIHPTPQGAKMIANIFTGQLLLAFDAYQRQHPPAPLQPAPPPPAAPNPVP